MINRKSRSHRVPGFQIESLENRRLLSSGFALFPELGKHVVLQPPCGPEVSWELHSNQGPAPQGGRPCSLPPRSSRSYSSSAPSSPRRASTTSGTSPPDGASRLATATSPS